MTYACMISSSVPLILLPPCVTNGTIVLLLKSYSSKKDKIICGYHTIINWDRTNVDNVMAMIQINATPEREYGYDRIAKKIYSFPEVDTMYLLSGSFEFVAIVKGHTMQEVAHFVGSKLAPLEGVIGTATMFVLKQYKNNGISFDDNDKDSAERLLVTP